MKPKNMIYFFSLVFEIRPAMVLFCRYIPDRDDGYDVIVHYSDRVRATAPPRGSASATRAPVAALLVCGHSSALHVYASVADSSALRG